MKLSRTLREANIGVFSICWVLVILLSPSYFNLHYTSDSCAWRFGTQMPQNTGLNSTLSTDLDYVEFCGFAVFPDTLG